MSLESKSISGFRYCKCLGVENQLEKLEFLFKRNIYKYMNMENAIKCIKNGYLFFQEPSKWIDGYEKKFYDGDFSGLPNGNLYSPKVYACCLTLNDSSEPAWNTYSYDNKGLSAKCVQFVIYRKRLRECLEKYARMERRHRMFYECKVKYDILQYYIDRMDKPSDNVKIQTLHEMYFSDFDKDKYLSTLLIKRPAYYYENEVRYLFEDTTDTLKSRIDPNASSFKMISVDWGYITNRIYVEEKCSDIEMELFREKCDRICDENGWNHFVIEKSNFHANDLTPATIEP